MNEIVNVDEVKSSFSKEVGVETKFQCLKYKNNDIQTYVYMHIYILL